MSLSCIGEHKGISISIKYHLRRACLAVAQVRGASPVQYIFNAWLNELLKPETCPGGDLPAVYDRLLTKHSVKLRDQSILQVRLRSSERRATSFPGSF